MQSQPFAVRLLRGRSLDKVDVSWAACFGGCLMLLLLPLRWCFAMVVASAVHELFHIVSVWLCVCPIYSMSIQFGGAVIKTNIADWRKELLCILSGPVGSLILVIFYKFIPEIAVCALLQSAYNLLPLPNLDGGRALRCIHARVFQKNTLQR